MTRPNALQQWQASGLRPVELPTGVKALVRLPNVPALLAAGAFPDDLRKLAAQYASSGIEISKLEGDDLQRFVHLTYDLISRALKYLAPLGSTAWDKFQETGADPADEGWEAVALQPGELAEMDLDQDDLDALGKIVGRQVTTLAVTFSSRMERGIVSAQDAQKAIAGGGGGETLGDHAGFRRQPGGADRGTDREDVRDAPVDAARDRGSRRGVRSR